MSGRSVDKSVDSAGPKSGRAPVVAALDLGQSKVACFIMKADGVRHADRTIRVAGFPSIGAEHAMQSRLAVLVETDGAVAGVAIQKLDAWLPASSVEQSNIRLGQMGEVSMVTVPGTVDPLSMVVVNLREMGYLIS